MKNKRGIIRVNESLLYRDNDLMKEFFSSFFPFNIEHMFENTCKISCISEYFDEIIEGDKIPEYDVIMKFSSDSDKKYSIESVKKICK